jgi:hypothetical protein
MGHPRSAASRTTRDVSKVKKAQGRRQHQPTFAEESRVESKTTERKPARTGVREWMVDAASDPAFTLTARRAELRSQSNP